MTKDIRLGRDPLAWLGPDHAPLPPDEAGNGLTWASRHALGAIAGGVTGRLLDHSLLAYVRCDAAGRILECNQAFQRLMGRDERELQGRCWPVDFIGRRDFDVDEERYQTDGTPRRLVLKLAGPGRETRLLDVFEHGVFGESGGLSGLVCLLSEIPWRPVDQNSFLYGEALQLDTRKAEFQTALYEAMRMLVDVSVGENDKKLKSELKDIRRTLTSLAVSFQSAMEGHAVDGLDVQSYLEEALKEQFGGEAPAEPRVTIEAGRLFLTGAQCFLAGFAMLVVILAARQSKKAKQGLRVGLARQPDGSADLTLALDGKLPKNISERDKLQFSVRLMRDILVRQEATFILTPRESGRLEIILKGA